MPLFQSNLHAIRAGRRELYADYFLAGPALLLLCSRCAAGHVLSGEAKKPNTNMSKQTFAIRLDDEEPEDVT